MTPNVPTGAKEIKLWTGIHFIIGLGVPMILLFFFGCKELKEERAPLGPEVQPAQVLQALGDALAETRPQDTKANEGVLIEENVKIESGYPEVVRDVVKIVLKVVDTASSLDIHYLQTVYDYSDNSKLTDTDVVKIPYATSEALKAHNISPDMLLPKQIRLDNDTTIQQESSLAKLLTSDVEEQASKRTTYHELIVEKRLQAPPLLVQRQKNCGGVPSCQMRVTFIQFDIAEWEANNEDFSKTRVTFEISPDAPYFGYIVSECQARQIPYEGRTLYIKPCNVLRDFQYEAQ